MGVDWSGQVTKGSTAEYRQGRQTPDREAPILDRGDYQKEEQLRKGGFEIKIGWRLVYGGGQIVE